MNENRIEANQLSDVVKHQIDDWLCKYPKEQQRSGVLYALRLAQEDNGGWLTEDLMAEVADYLKLPYIAIYEVATFYSMYDLKPVGKHKIKVCTSITCVLRGSDKLIRHLKSTLGIELGETTPDGRFTLKAVECLAACGNAPAIQINDRDYHEDITPEKIDLLLRRLESEENMDGK